MEIERVTEVTITKSRYRGYRHMGWIYYATVNGDHQFSNTSKVEMKSVIRRHYPKATFVEA
jgi:hypothetical protein